MQKLNLKIYLFLSLTLILFSAANVSAEVIYLKSGQSVEGKVVEKTDKYIKIDLEGVTLTYFLEDIERIDGEQAVAAKVTTPAPSVESQEETYLNSEYNFSIIWPKGWYKRKEDSKEGGFRIVYARDKDPSPVMDLPIFGLFLLPLHPTAKTPLEIANKMVSEWKVTQPAFDVGEPPQEFEVNNIKGARFIYDMSKNQEFRVRILNVVFVKDDLVFHFALFVRREEFDQAYKDIEKSINSFKFIEPLKLSGSAERAFLNEELGFEITGPQGWFMYVESPIRGSRVFFNKNQSIDPKRDYWGISVSIDKMGAKETSALDFAKSVAEHYRKARIPKISEEPRELEISGVKAAVFTVESPVGNLGYAFKMRQYVFQKADNAISVMYMNRGDDFNNDLKSFEETISVFRLTEGLRSLEEQIEQAKPNFLPLDKQEYLRLRDEIINRMQNIKSFSCIYLRKGEVKTEAKKGIDTVYYARARVISPKEFEVLRWFGASGGLPADQWRRVDDKLYTCFIGMWMELTALKKPEDNTKVEANEMPEWAGFYEVVTLQQHLETLKKEAAVGIDRSQAGYLGLQFKNILIPRLPPSQAKSSDLDSAEIVMWIAQSDNTLKAVQAKFANEEKSILECDWFYGYFNYPFVIGKPLLIYEDKDKDKS